MTWRRPRKKKTLDSGARRASLAWAMHGRLLAFFLTLAIPTLSRATDVPIAACRLELRATGVKAEKRSATLSVRDRALAAPFPDPRLGAALVVHGGAEPGQCR